MGRSSSYRRNSLFQEYAKTFFYAFCLALLIRTFLFAPFMIPTGSMRPTLMEGDRILVNKIVYGIRVPFSGKRFLEFRQPRRGDLVVFRSPDRKKDFIKRLVAIGGDEIEIRDRRLWINGRPASEPAVFQELVYYNRGQHASVGKKFRVPEGHFFFLGDNSASSRDSRYFGALPKYHVVGRAFLIVWPLNRIRWFQ